MVQRSKHTAALFPAYAGVIPTATPGPLGWTSFPRICGGDPGGEKLRTTYATLFPAYAGVILLIQQQAQIDGPFPRTRGGDPRIGRNMLQAMVFSPHTRG